MLDALGIAKDGFQGTSQLPNASARSGYQDRRLIGAKVWIAAFFYFNHLSEQ